MLKINRKITLLLILMLLITSLPIQTVFAGNNDSLPSNPNVGQGSSAWNYDEGWEGVRLSIYWAPSEQDFINGNDKVVQIGETKDFTKTGPRYKVEQYTAYSIYWYMNGDSVGLGEPYKPTSNTLRPYYYIGKEDSSIVANMPKVFNGNKTDWDNWIESNNYKNIEEISRLLGQKVTAEDFISGDLVVDGYQVKAKGLYKLFIEPIIYPTVAGVDMVLTLRDAIRWEEAFTRGEIKTTPIKSQTTGQNYNPSLLMNLTPIFEYLANSQFLIDDEPVISMTANTSNYRVDGSINNSSKREELRKQIQKGGKVYSSMGVGVFTSPNTKLQEVSTVVESYVKIVGINADGTLRLEEVKESEIKQAEFNNNGTLKVNKVVEVDEGTLYLNDIIISPKKLIEDVEWVEDLPKTPREQINPTPDDILKYRLGEVTGVVASLIKVSYTNISINVGGGQTISVYPELISISEDLKANKEVSISRIQEAVIKVDKAYSEIDLSLASPEFIQALVRISLEKEMVKYNSRNSVYEMVVETFYKSAEFISDLNEIYLDTEKALEGSVVVNPAKSSVETEGNKPVVYIRYILIPTRKEVQFIETYKNGALVDKQRVVRELPISESSKGVYEYETSMTDMRNEGLELVSWGTSKEAPLLNQMPKNPIKSGVTYEAIKGLDADENVYVTWRQDIYTGITTSNYLVDEWRLSKFTDNLGYSSKAYMSLSLTADEGHSSSRLSPSGAYRYDTVNPNNKITDKNYNPANLNYTSYLHSKAITKGSYSISHGSPSVLVDITGNLNLIKSTELASLRVASWTVDNNTKTALNLHNLEVNNRGVNYTGVSVISKQDVLKYSIKNKDSYNHTYSVYYHYTCHHFDKDGKHFGCHDVCDCYSIQETAGVNYSTADYKVESMFERYITQDTKGSVLNVSPVKKETNGKTTIALQDNTELMVYPEVPMLFENDRGDDSLVFAVGDYARVIKPVTYHSMEYKAFVIPKTVGLAVATDSRAKSTAIGNKPVIYKGAGANTSYEVKESKGTNVSGTLTVKSYALDISDTTLKGVWGNSGYNTTNIHDNFLSHWSFKGTATSNLEVVPTVGGAVVYEGPLNTNPISYNKKSTEGVISHQLTVRGGVVTHVNGIPVNNISSELKEALAGMKLIVLDVSGNVVINKAATVFSTFEHQKGKALTEVEFKNLASAARNGIDNLEVGRGWYSEDTTVLTVREHTTIYTLPGIAFADKIPMSITGLETPVNKQQFFSKIYVGHSNLKYEITANIPGLNKVKTYFETTSRVADNFGGRTVDYGVPNVSVLDTLYSN